MKNYYDQQLELELAKNRLTTLKEKKKLYFEETQPKSKKINGVVVQSSMIDNNKFLEYTAKIEYLDDEIDVLENEIKILESYLKRMENTLRSMKGALEKVFVAKYIDGLSVKQIVIRVNYSKTQVYRYLSIIQQIIKDGKKWEK
jgi:DNA-directed RNA polymerase specialized sigma24 family protein